MVVAFASGFKAIIVENVGDFVYNVTLNREKQLNAMNGDLFTELRQTFEEIDRDPNCRVAVLSANGRAFCVGLDLAVLTGMERGEDEDVARFARKIQRSLGEKQECITTLERCCKPVIAAIHGYCVGGGISLAAACDVRYATKNAVFSFKETNVGLAADLGALNRLPHIIGNSGWLREVSMTARDFNGEEAHKYGFVTKVCGDSKETVEREALALARQMAVKSPIAVTGTKVVLNLARDHPVADGLKLVQMWQGSQMQTEDIPAAVAAMMQKQGNPTFSKL